MIQILNGACMKTQKQVEKKRDELVINRTSFILVYRIKRRAKCIELMRMLPAAQRQ